MNLNFILNQYTHRFVQEYKIFLHLQVVQTQHQPSPFGVTRLTISLCSFFVSGKKWKNAKYLKLNGPLT